MTTQRELSRRPEAVCDVLVVSYDRPQRETEWFLDAMTCQGWRVMREPGQSDVVQARNSAVANWLDHSTRPYVLCVDDDMIPRGEVAGARALVKTAIREGHELLSGVYVPKRFGTGRFCLDWGGRDSPVVIGEGGTIEPAHAVGFGCVVLARALLDRMCEREPWVELDRFGRTVPLLFDQRIVPGTRAQPGTMRGEDFGFCDRARAAGALVRVDTRSVWGHIGAYTYWPEDAFTEREPAGSFIVQPNLPPPEPLP